VEHLMSEPGTNELNEAGSGAQGTAQSVRQPGAQLAAVREEYGWTVEQVAAQLNLAPRQVHAIEKDDYAALPGMAVTRGFVRAYAKLLKVDAAPLLATMAGDAPMSSEAAALRRPLSTPFSETRTPLMSRKHGLPVRKIGILVVAAAIVAGAWALYQTGSLNKLHDLASSNANKAAASAVEPAPSAATPEQPQPVEAKPETASSDIVPDNAAAQASSPQAEVPAATAAAEPNAPAPAATATATATAEETPAPASKDALVLNARQDSWVEIKRANNSVMYSRLMKAGSTETFEITGPVSVVIGNATGVDATLRGNPLTIKGNAGNVARLSVK
jgi:cytoskeleton protein RodZ